ncbi:plastocyanin/azurin family copper-binding protein [Conexibacter sp. JD483]|uniref:cupredoxin domain-containing protein n=1 Tax=unclassified Conexibacter TaxID=2627773 RepID=UPI00271E4FCA|nr:MULTISPECIES: plastocyanin/azurin family copper-binding protein [unclassified Conexibacter]MDO8185139.1 plastocyanin/azurin family copper-binding protein [Conexibacter sp. CPCC 205706]MDO8196849.1 plastocyanin/azurin family copper-binding protein [Conexibacter sp. CPCC 205762]MDR9368625.1 plastocyanin/azurin family copper-binding protein [Conexibacter sp. JD483]
MQRSLPLLLVLAAGALALAGCGGDDSGSGSSASTGAATAPATTSTDAAAAAGGDVEVKMQAIAYSPQTITVRPGTRITWVNEDDVLHDVVSTEGERIESRLFPKGDSFSFTPTRSGLIHYVCTIHPGMEGNITVE